MAEMYVRLFDIRCGVDVIQLGLAVCAYLDLPQYKTSKRGIV